MHGIARAAETLAGLVPGGIVADVRRFDQQTVPVAVANMGCGVERQQMQGRGDQRRGEVVQSCVEIPGRACRVLVGGRSQLGARMPRPDFLFLCGRVEIHCLYGPYFLLLFCAYE